MKLFVTGGTGFIGSHFLRCPSRVDHEVLALCRSSSPSRELDKLNSDWICRQMDALEPTDLVGCDVLVHFASPGVSPQKADWSELMYWNVVATLRLVQQARLAGVRRIVVAGTFAEYGRSADRFDPIPPNAPLEPTSAYASSKACASVMLSGFAIEQGIELAYLRIFSAYGEGQFEGNFWPSLKRAALAGEDFPMTPGEQVRDFIAVENVAKTFWKAATEATISADCPLQANVGSGEPISMKAFATDWWKKFGGTGKLLLGAMPYRSNEVMKFVPQITSI